MLYLAVERVFQLCYSIACAIAHHVLRWPVWDYERVINRQS